MKEIKKIYCGVSVKKCDECSRVEVIRCGKCKHWDPDSGYCQFWHGVRHPGHHCGEGEKKVDG